MNLSFKNRRRLCKIKRRFAHQPLLNPREQKIIEIVSRTIARRDCELIVAPISGNRYLTLDDKSLAIILTGQNAIVSNHKVHSDVSLGSDAVQILHQKFDKILESRRRIAEREIMANMMNALNDIASNVTKSLTP